MTDDSQQMREDESMTQQLKTRHAKAGAQEAIDGDGTQITNESLVGQDVFEG